MDSSFLSSFSNFSETSFACSSVAWSLSDRFWALPTSASYFCVAPSAAKMEDIQNVATNRNDQRLKFQFTQFLFQSFFSFKVLINHGWTGLQIFCTGGETVNQLPPVIGFSQ